MTEVWESMFKQNQAMWGFEPVDSAIEVVNLFQEKGLTKILIPGFGYGRNAKPFIDKGMKVTGIEISETAIEIAKKNYGDDVKIYHGSVLDMPFDQELYDGIFCYAVIHLFDENERLKLIGDCYNQLKMGGTMVFLAVSKNSSMYGQGELVSEDRFLNKGGVKLFFYDSDGVENEFGEFGLVEAIEVTEPAENTENEPSLVFWQIICEKEE